MKSLILPAALALFAGAAFAGDKPEFSALDLNEDGMLTAEEAGVIESMDFTAADVDQNGVLSEAEYRAAI